MTAPTPAMPDEPKATKATLLRDCDDADHPKSMSANDGITRAASARIRCLIAHYDLLRAYATHLRRDKDRLDWLEKLLKNNGGHWQLVSVQTIPEMACVHAVNEHHGAEAGLVTAMTLREAIDEAIDREEKEND